MPDFPPDGAPIDDDELQRCIAVLRAIDADRGLLAQVSPALRVELLQLAGLVAKPEKHQFVRMAKAFRRADREAAKAADRGLIVRRLSVSCTLITPVSAKQAFTVGIVGVFVPV